MRVFLRKYRIYIISMLLFPTFLIPINYINRTNNTEKPIEKITVDQSKSLVTKTADALTVFKNFYFYYKDQISIIMIVVFKFLAIVAALLLMFV